MRASLIPYCGEPPWPGEAGWNLDPALILVLLALLAWGWRACPRRPALVAGVGVLALALLSPLCALAVALFSARVAQHMAMVLLAAPLLALGLATRAPSAPLAAAGFALALWISHLPGPYAWTFSSHLGWWTLHAVLLLSAIWLWQALARARPEAALAAGLATAAQMGGLGAFLTFAPRPLYAPHALSTLPWGLSPLEDQQLGGLLMWVPGGTLFAVLALLAVARALRDPRPAA